jgi:hypothetical protein
MLKAQLAQHLAPTHFPHFDMTDVVTFAFDDRRLLHPSQSHAGAVWVTPTAQPGEPLPLFIYMHGLNRQRIQHRWLHGSVWDMRTIVGPLAMAGLIGPMAVVVPSTTSDDAFSSLTIYRTLDVAALVEAAAQALAPQGFVIDRERVIFTAHSASSCANHNGLFAGIGDHAAPIILNIDGCMNQEFGNLLGDAPDWQQVIVLYQDYMWRRDYSGFLATWNRAVARHPNAVRTIEYYRMVGNDVHNQIVPIALRKWLPRLVPPTWDQRNTAPASAPAHSTNTVPPDASLPIASSPNRQSSQSPQSSPQSPSPQPMGPPPNFAPMDAGTAAR